MRNISITDVLFFKMLDSIILILFQAIGDLCRIARDGGI